MSHDNAVDDAADQVLASFSASNNESRSAHETCDDEAGSELYINV